MSMSNTTNSTALTSAYRYGSLGVGFSGSGALILYFTGVTAVLQHLGIISSNNSMAGASGGAINAALTCAQVPLRTQYDALTGLAARCRAANNCQGILNSTLGAELSSLIPANASELCNSTLWVAVTEAKPNGTNDTSVLLGSNWNSTQEILAAALMSAYLPGISTPSATVKFPELHSIGSGYDGGFTRSLPCPPGVGYCVKVSAAENQGANVAGFVATYNGMATSPRFKTLAAVDPATGPFLPLNPSTLPDPKADIYPGLAKPLPVNATEWGSWGLRIPDNATLKMVYDTGREDAAFWASREGLATAANATKALQATAVSR